MESLDRGLVAVKNPGGVFLSWRLSGTENPATTFNVYKNGTLLNGKPIAHATNFTDAAGQLKDEYTVKKMENGRETEISKTVKPWEKPFLTLQMKRPPKADDASEPDVKRLEYFPNEAGVADLDGDGEYELVVKWDARARDNAHRGRTDPVFLDGYKLDGTHLWRIGLGKNIRAGQHYTQMIVYDLDGDGKAELVCKTAPGTLDGKGEPVLLGDDDADADYRSENGYVLEGPEYLTVFDGETGAQVQTIPYYPPRGNVRDWGDDYGNRVDRFLACVGYFDGQHPSVVMCRGYYTRAVLAAYDFADGKLKERWIYDTGTSRDGKATAYGQGNHSIDVGDVDGDGFDEIVYGGACIDHDGKLLYSTGLGHGDAAHLGDMDPDRPGLEFFCVHESKSCPAGMELRDAGTGELLFGLPSNMDVGRGLAANIDPNHRGYEFWSALNGNVYNIKGEVISTKKPSANFRVFWDGDLLDELLNGVRLDKWNGNGVDRLVDFADYGATSGNGGKATPVLSADIFGDWREEIVYFSKEDPSRLMIFTTTIPTEHKRVTLMHDHVYRMKVAVQNVVYNQPPHTGYHFAE
ncbi:MAG TPA: rhamnogalacturonan lyase [Planctomycetaceae bacterium]|nr:rhamnogalacturonan lyase [Planctomycetaceae bacterium]